MPMKAKINAKPFSISVGRVCAGLRLGRYVCQKCFAGVPPFFALSTKFLYTFGPGVQFELHALPGTTSEELALYHYWGLAVLFSVIHERVSNPTYTRRKVPWAVDSSDEQSHTTTPCFDTVEVLEIEETTYPFNLIGVPQTIGTRSKG